MPTGKFSATTLDLDAPTYLSLAEAAEKYNLSEEAVVQLIQAGQLQAAQLSSGEVLVAADNDLLPQTKEQIIEDKFAHLKGKSIGLRAAAREYKLHKSTLHRWVKAGYIGQTQDSKLNKSEVAYCAYVYQEYKRSLGSQTIKGGRIFDEEGNPYQLKHPELAEYRRRMQRDNTKDKQNYKVR